MLFIFGSALYPPVWVECELPPGRMHIQLVDERGRGVSGVRMCIPEIRRLTDELWDKEGLYGIDIPRIGCPYKCGWLQLVLGWQRCSVRIYVIKSGYETIELRYPMDSCDGKPAVLTMRRIHSSR